MLYAFYETYEDNLMEVGHLRPLDPERPCGAGHDAHRGPACWTGDDMP